MRSEALREAVRRLETAGVSPAEPDAERLLLHALGIERAAFWADPHRPLPPEVVRRFEDLLRARASRVPAQNLLGDAPFHGVALKVDHGVFIPRSETEGLVELVLARLPADSRGTLFDWGTGTGAIAVAVLAARPLWRGVAADSSEQAVALARENARQNGVADRLHLVCADLLADPDAPLREAGRAIAGADPPRAASGAVLAAPYDAVLGNPPYVPRAEIAALMPEVRLHDPHTALDGGPDGLDAFRVIARHLVSWLRPGGLLALEIGAGQADAVEGLFAPHLDGGRVVPDLSGRPRTLIGTMRGGVR